MATTISTTALEDEGKDTQTMSIKGGNVDPVDVSKPWGQERTAGNIGDITLKQLTLLPYEAIAQQLHVWKREMYYVLDGSGVLELGKHGEVLHHLTPGNVVYLPAGVVHRLVAGENGITIIEISTGGPSNDIIRIGKAHGRQENPDFDLLRYWGILGMRAW